ncbi:MAG: hypothetical protein IPN69_07030 [Acidobacteria bacterium]|nr:hypothetical protein [Acidobacteriota bacterium]
MDIWEILRSVVLYVLTTGFLAVTVGLLIVTVGLPEFQDNFKLRDLGKNLFKHFF